VKTSRATLQRTDRIKEIIEKYRGEPGALIPVLQEVQEAFGYLSRDSMGQVAEGLGLPRAQVFGVASFYAQFYLKPRGQNMIRVCLGTACHVRGAEKVLAALGEALGIGPGEVTADGKFTLERVACLGTCGLAPAVMVNEEIHGRMDAQRAEELLHSLRN